MSPRQSTSPAQRSLRSGFRKTVMLQAFRRWQTIAQWTRRRSRGAQGAQKRAQTKRQPPEPKPLESKLPTFVSIGSWFYTAFRSGAAGAMPRLPGQLHDQHIGRQEGNVWIAGPLPSDLIVFPVAACSTIASHEVEARKIEKAGCIMQLDGPSLRDSGPEACRAAGQYGRTEPWLTGRQASLPPHQCRASPIIQQTDCQSLNRSGSCNNSQKTE